MIRKYILKITTLIAIMILPATSVAVQLPNDKQPSTAGIVEVFDANNKIIGSVPGIAIDGGGYIITEYEPFRNAARADYVMGKNRIAVSRVGGASDLYDVIKLLPEKNVGHSFAVSSTAPKAGDKVKIIGSKAKKGTAIETQIMEVSSSNSINYLSLAQAYDAANVGLPVVNAKGELIGVVQRNGGKDAKTYAIDAKYCSDMSISAMSWGAASLTNIKIPAELPKEEKSAWNYIYMMLETRPLPHLPAGTQGEQPPQELQAFMDCRHVCIRPKIAGTILQYPSRDEDAGIFFLQGDLYIGIALVVLEADIVARTVLLDEIALQNQGFHLGRGHNGFKIRNPCHHCPDFWRVALILLKILAHPILQDDGLAHVDDFPMGILHEINSRRIRQELQFFLHNLCHAFPPAICPFPKEARAS